MDIRFDMVDTYKNTIPLEKANEVLRKRNQLVMIGFDILQIPKFTQKCDMILKYLSEVSP